MTLEQVINGVVDKNEGGFVDDPLDKGKATKYGITQDTARANGYTGDMKDLSRDFAFRIYKKRYVQEPRFDSILDLNASIGMELIDTGINMGTHRAAEFLQRWLNAFNDKGSHYGELHIDGAIGSVTLNAFAAFLSWRGAEGAAVLLKALNCIQGYSYLDIVEHDPTQRRFAYGWMKNRVA